MQDLQVQVAQAFIHIIDIPIVAQSVLLVFRYAAQQTVLSLVGTQRINTVHSTDMSRERHQMIFQPISRYFPRPNEGGVTSWAV